MQLFTFFAVATTLIAGSNALVMPRNKHVADFRLFKEEGCYKGNLGVYTVIDDDFKNGECKGFNGVEPRSLSLTDINKGCTFTAYSDYYCRKGRVDFKVKHCYDNKYGFQAWSIKCDHKDYKD